MLRTIPSLAAALAFLAIGSPAVDAASDAKAPSCATPFSEPSVLRAATPTLPTIAREQGIRGSSVLEIRLSPNGKLLASKIAISSGNRWLDRAALETAAETRFVAEKQDCSAVGGTYMLTIDFE